MFLSLFSLEYSHSVPDASQDPRQNYATPSFRELHKVQRQILHASNPVANDNSTTVSVTQTSANVQSPEDDGDGYQLRQALSAGAQARVTDKNQVFLPGMSCSCRGPCNINIDCGL